VQDEVIAEANVHFRRLSADFGYIRSKNNHERVIDDHTKNTERNLAKPTTIKPLTWKIQVGPSAVLWKEATTFDSLSLLLGNKNYNHQSRLCDLHVNSKIFRRDLSYFFPTNVAPSKTQIRLCLSNTLPFSHKLCIPILSRSYTIWENYRCNRRQTDLHSTSSGCCRGRQKRRRCRRCNRPAYTSYQRWKDTLLWNKLQAKFK